MSGGHRVQQDYIARIRYSNALPPPAHPPKLLDVPGTGLAGGDYTSAGYASRLARDQPLNIEADAELGMPIDLVGIPGVFDGDERGKAIMARPKPEPLHPTDKQLLKPLSALGKGAGGAVSFLRRTEYTASQGAQHYSAASKDLTRVRNDPKRRKANLPKEDPLNIIRNIVKGFDVAYPEDAYKGEENVSNIRGAAITDADAKAWTNPKHPAKPGVELLDSYPVLPDLEALPTSGCYIVAKFQTNPGAAGDHYDERLDAAILRPKDDNQAYALWEQKTAEWSESSKKAYPIPEDDYDYFLPAESSYVRGVKRKLNVNDPENDDDELYTDDVGDGQRAFKYTRLRLYETYGQQGNPRNFYDESVALALHDPETEIGDVPGTKHRLSKGAYFYPIQQRTALRPKRRVGQTALSQVVDEDQVDEINLAIGDLDEGSKVTIQNRKTDLDPTLRGEAAPAVEAAA
ncbi:hypothetical protein LTR37_001282 [Vermiconidia calcicola]|uniref:Uncharacterized protein n=1 Tax=Vermiconidia calcicola TaxID=1690605 RepID=A0ACC3NWM5_9PEZI|nr:hypothetical protein LTR37_001282 [Vermiconidia calcicola]